MQRAPFSPNDAFEAKTDGTARQWPPWINLDTWSVARDAREMSASSIIEQKCAAHMCGKRRGSSIIVGGSGGTAPATRTFHRGRRSPTAVVACPLGQRARKDQKCRRRRAANQRTGARGRCHAHPASRARLCGVACGLERMCDFFGAGRMPGIFFIAHPQYRSTSCATCSNRMHQRYASELQTRVRQRMSDSISARGAVDAARGDGGGASCTIARDCSMHGVRGMAGSFSARI